MEGLARVKLRPLFALINLWRVGGTDFSIKPGKQSILFSQPDGRRDQRKENENFNMKLRFQAFSNRVADKRSITGSLLTSPPALLKSNRSGNSVSLLVTSFGVAMALWSAPAK